MWANRRLTLPAGRSRQGFTIVELLIVIVVIAILATITIVAYNGIQGRAVAASLMSDLDNASKQFKLYQVDNSIYPAAIDCSVTPAANTICLKSSTGTAYTTFTPNNATSPQTFCLTATNGTTNYFINQDSTPASGGCAVTNLVVNPSFETNVSLWGYLAAGEVSSSSSAQSKCGSSSLLMSRVSTSGTLGMAHNPTPYPLASIGQTISASGYMWLSKAGTAKITFSYRDSSRSDIRDAQSTTFSLAAQTWTRVYFTDATAPTGTTGVELWFAPVGTWNMGDSVYLDCAILTGGPVIYNYADGSSPSWVWNGSPNGSTSTGPAQ